MEHPAVQEVTNVKDCHAKVLLLIRVGQSDWLTRFGFIEAEMFLFC